MSTPHIHAEPGAIADTVLLPGDPLRARRIAQRFLSDAVEVNRVRNMFGYTGHYRGRGISVLGSGMGMPSCLLYATELLCHFGVRRIVRIGTCGALQPDLRLGDCILATAASTDSNLNRRRFAGMDYAAAASFSLCRQLANTADARGHRLQAGSVFSTDRFYDDSPGLHDLLRGMGILAVEMEAAALYAIAAEHKAQAAALLTVSDELHSGRHYSSEEREAGLDAATELCLEGLLGAMP